MEARAYNKITNNPEPVVHPFFSIIIATYNRAQLLKRALDSLIAQTENDWEAIIIDDESTDDTYNKILPYLMSYPRFKSIHRLADTSLSWTLMTNILLFILNRGKLF
jgi:glycosyltransferase involved in cell wall biosynthesis